MIAKIIRNLAIPICVLIVLWFIAGCIRAYGQSDTCANGDQLVLNTSLKRYQCITPGTQPAGTGTTMLVANETVTGTTVNRLAKLTGAPSKAIITATTDTENAVGIVTSGAGTAGNATIAILGQASCDFDGATTAGNYFIISATTAGKCRDAGSSFPTSGATYGRVLSTNGGAGTYVVELMTPDIAFQNAGNGKSKPGGSNLDYQYNSSNTFAGGRVKQEATNTVSVDGGTNAQTFQVYFSNNAGVFNRMRITNTSGPWRFFSETNTGASGGDMQWLLGTGSTGVSMSGADFFPITAGMNLGNSTGWGQVKAQSIFVTSAGVAYSSPDLELIPAATGRLWVRRLSNNGGGTGVQVGDSNTSGFILKKGSGGTAEIRDGGDAGYYWLTTAGAGFTSAQFDKTNTTLANVTGLVSETLLAGKTYTFNAELFVDADVTGGSKYAIAGTATATTIKYYVEMICDATNLLVITSRQTALAGSAGQAGCTAGLTRISGTITVNAAGTLAVQFAQNAASGTSSVLTMSKFEVRQLN